MTKIVYNACYGGFGLSDEAIMRYAEIKGITLYSSVSRFGLTNYYLCPPEEYERILAPYKDKDVSILEIGTYKNGFLGWLKENFPKARLFGIDISPTPMDGITMAKIDQTDTGGLAEFGRKHGMFDVVIDDAIHETLRTKGTFGAMWAFVKSGGVYVVEDFIASFWGRKDPRFSYAVGMEDLVFQIAMDKDLLGVRDFELILREPKCSLAAFTKK
jgi:hypothetical protein